jgi:tRNA-splicing endonuclease subunit Sen34
VAISSFIQVCPLASARRQAYSGADDPLRYHSHFSTTVIPSLEQEIRPIDLVSMGRLATAVKKAHLLCGYDGASEEVSFYSLEWAAMG